MAQLTVEEQHATRWYQRRFNENPMGHEIRMLVDYGKLMKAAGHSQGMDEQESRSRNRPGDGDMGG